MSYVTIGGNQYHVEQSLAEGKDKFIAARKGSVRDVAKVWEQIEGMAGEKPPQKKTGKAPSQKN